MKRMILLLGALVGALAAPYDATASNAWFSLNLEFDTQGDFSSGGTWTAVAKADERGFAGISMVLTELNFDETTGFLAPGDFEVQDAAFFGLILNVVIGDDLSGAPTLDIGVIGGTWPSTYLDDVNLALYGANPDLGSFTGGVALATGSFDPGDVPVWFDGGPTNRTAANLLDDSANVLAVDNGNIFLTVRHVVPEPSAIVLIGFAVACACGLRRRV